MMGYTHYWEMPDKVMDENVLKDVEMVLDKYKNIVQVEFNENGKPIVEKDVIKFNGIGDEGHETFYLAPAKDSGNFCKTSEKPYDIAVCEVLLVLKHHYGKDFELKSDGFHVTPNDFEKGLLDGNWNEAIGNVKERYGYEFELIPKIEGVSGYEYYSFDVETKGITKESEKNRWSRENYTVELVDFDHDLKVFEVVQDDKVITTIYPSTIEDMNEMIKDLNDGADVNGWENGLGETVHIPDSNENIKVKNNGLDR